MSNDEKIKLGKELIDYKIPSNNKIYFPENNTVGIEIEFKNAKMSQVSDELFERESSFHIIPESTITKKDPIGGSFSRGGEAISPVITCNFDYYNSLKEVCDIIKFCNGEIDFNTACHIHIGSQSFKDFNSIDNLLFIWANFEDVINRFLNGNNVINNHNSIFSKNCNIRFKESNYSFNHLKEAFKKDNAVSFYYFKSFSYEKGNTIEFRNMRSTFDEDIILNNIRFLFRLIDFLNSCSNASLRKLSSFIDKFNFKEEFNFEKVCFLSNLIYDNKLEKYSFLKQYFKDFYKEGEVKVLKLTR